jgi:3-dehydroquinate synthase
MVKVNINLSERSYPIYITENYEGLVKVLDKLRFNGKICIITDSNVHDFQYKDLIAGMGNHANRTIKYIIEPGEKNKNLDTVINIYKYLTKNRFDRSSAIISFGGGVTGDISGFAAATFLRGIRYIQVPTTLLAQADSSVGGKTGVDFEGVKNMIGSFYQPKLVYINVNSLKTLPPDEIRTGLAETVKHGLIASADFFEYVDYNVKKIFDYNTEVLQYIAKMNCIIKGGIVEKDEKESGLRSVLNLGHTIGHAIESTSDFNISHGNCVSIGLNGAFKLALALEMTNENTYLKVTNTIGKIGLPLYLPGMDVEKVYKQMFFDKKINAGKLKFILPKGIGNVIPCIIENENLIKSTLYELSV